jgi:hypothetical protein
VAARADTGAAAAVQGATVSVLRTALSATTGADGRFLLERAPVGPLTLRVRLLGYRTADQVIRVRAGDTVRINIILEAEAQLLAPVRTDAQATDVEMFVSKPNVATVAMGKAAMAGVPSVGEPDVVRVVQLLPGVVARNDFNTGLNVRGGEADQNLILLDGHPIYNPFHFGGLFSTFMDATVGSIELMTAAFPARYGGRLSSVLDVRSAEEARAGLHASADVSALGATGRLAGSFSGGLGSWSIAGRRTYADAVTTVFTNNVFPYHFRDFQGHATYVFPGNVRLAVTGYAGRDILDANLAEFEADSERAKGDGRLTGGTASLAPRSRKRSGARRSSSESPRPASRRSSTWVRAHSPSATQSATSGSAGRCWHVVQRTTARSATTWPRIAFATCQAHHRRGRRPSTSYSGRRLAPCGSMTCGVCRPDGSSREACVPRR